jgi:cell division protein FtsA
MLADITSIGEDVLGVPVRLGVPRGVGGLADVVRSPMYATGVGLVVYGAKQIGASQKAVESTQQARDANLYGRMGRKMRNWLSEIF